MELDVLSIIVKLGGRNTCFILHMDLKCTKNCPTELSHVPGVTQLEYRPWVSGTLHRMLFTKCPLLAFYSPNKSVSCSHKPKAKKQNGLLKPRLSFLLLEEKSTAAKFVDAATTRRETFHKPGFVCNHQWGKRGQTITAERQQLLPALQVNPASTRKATRAGT